MSTYYTLEGTLEAKDKNQLAKAVEYAKAGGWINESENFTDENNEPISEDSAISGLCLEIPYGTHRNIFTFINKCKELGLTFTGKGFCTDGCFEGYKDGESFDLDDWARKNFAEPNPNYKQYNDEDEKFEDLLAWQNDVAESFMEEN